MFKPLSDLNVITQFKAETSASSSVFLRLPAILLRNPSHTLYFMTNRNIHFRQA
jgi:hypothetical protein